MLLFTQGENIKSDAITPAHPCHNGSIRIAFFMGYENTSTSFSNLFSVESLSVSIHVMNLR